MVTVVTVVRGRGRGARGWARVVSRLVEAVEPEVEEEEVGVEGGVVRVERVPDALEVRRGRQQSGGGAEGAGAQPERARVCGLRLRL